MARSAAAPDAPLRILNLFAQQALACDSVSISRSEDSYAVAVIVSGLDRHRADILLEKMRAMVLVEEAECTIAPPNSWSPS